MTTQETALSGDQVRQIVLDRVRKSAKIQAAHDLTESVRLDALGVDSIGIISLLVQLEREIALDFDRVGLDPPQTVGDVVRIAIVGCGLEAQP